VCSSGTARSSTPTQWPLPATSSSTGQADAATTGTDGCPVPGAGRDDRQAERDGEQDDEVEVRCMLTVSVRIGGHLVAAEHAGRRREDVMELIQRRLLA
jgi:hypothetical protein